MITKGKPTRIPQVSGSLRTTTPSASATAGAMKVMTVVRDGPASAISAKKTRKAAAVQYAGRIRESHGLDAQSLNNLAAASAMAGNLSAAVHELELAVRADRGSIGPAMRNLKGFVALAGMGELASAPLAGARLCTGESWGVQRIQRCLSLPPCVRNIAVRFDLGVQRLTRSIAVPHASFAPQEGGLEDALENLGFITSLF